MILRSHYSQKLDNIHQMCNPSQHSNNKNWRGNKIKIGCWVVCLFPNLAVLKVLCSEITPIWPAWESSPGQLYGTLYCCFSPHIDFIKEEKSGYGEIGTPIHSYWACTIVELLWKTIWKCYIKLTIELMNIWSFISTCPQGLKTETWDNCTPIFITTLFIITKMWKQPKFQLEW